MARRVTLPESKIRRRKRQARQRMTVGLISFAIVISGGLVGASWLPQIRIQTVEATSTQGIATSSVTDFVKEKISGRVFLLFPADNILLYPKSEIERALRAEYPAAKEAAARIINFKTLEISFVERSTFALWCGESPGSEAPCRRMDENGLAYALAANFSEGDYFRYVGPATTSEGFTASEPPRQFLTPEGFRALASLVQALAKNQADTRVGRIVVDEAGDAKLSFENGFSVIFALRDDGGDVYERFTLGLASEPFLNRKISDFEYLDLRFGDKLYYHLKDR
jgi:hypothetical protein